MATRVALALLCTVTSFTPPTHTRPGTKLRKTRGAGGDLVDPDAGAPDDDAMTELRERMMQEELKQRKQTIKEGKGNRLSAQYVELLTAQHPSELVGAFYREADPRVQVAIQDAIMGMLGAGAVDIEFTTTGSRIAELCFRLQMTGYVRDSASVSVVFRTSTLGRWRLHESAPPRRRRCGRQRVYAPRESGFATESFPRRCCGMPNMC